MDSRSTRRRIAIVAVFCPLLAGGVFWLTTTVINASRQPTAPGPDSTVSASVAPADGPADGPAEPDGPEAGPPVPRRTIQVGGVTLDGSNPDLTCTIFTNEHFEVPVRVRAVVFTPTTPGVVLAPAHCGVYHKRKCRAGITLQPGGRGCYVGIGVQEGRPAGVYEAKVGLALVARCLSREVVPCADLNRDAELPADVVWVDDGAPMTVDFAGLETTEPAPETTEPAPEISETGPENLGTEPPAVEATVPPDPDTPATR